MFDRLQFTPDQTVVMICGPEGMMHAVIHELVPRGVSEDHIWVSMERNMQCATGHCGHCQIGGKFVCKDGPVFRYPDIKKYICMRGF
jgi:NAD(P)H-flavin reductase